MRKRALAARFLFWEQAMAEIPEVAQRARQMYADGVDTRTIMAETDFSLEKLYNWVDGRASRKGEQLLPPLPRRRVVRHLRISPGDRRSLVERMMRSAERQVAEIELRVGSPRHDREKDARMLAVLARAMRELTAVDALNRDLERAKDPAPDTDKSGQSDEPVPRDVEELRRSVSRKLQAIIAERTGDVDSGL
jgi:hypothetical protein